MIGEFARACRRGLGQMRAEITMSRALSRHSTFKRVQSVVVQLSRAYYFTSEKGLFRLDQTGIYQVLSIPCYGIVIGGPWVFLSLHIHNQAMVVRGDRNALLEGGRDFAFHEIYRTHVSSSNERIHGLYWGDDALWVANTGRNTLLKIDPDEARVIDEIAVILDRFDRPVLYNNNHINSVSEYGGVVMFVAYRAGEQSMIGIYDGTTVTGYGYPRTGVHDIFLTNTGFMLCDTFGENTETSGGAPITERGSFDPDFFAIPPGFIVRGLAGSPDELLIGHSHKGERSKRFDGHGAILVARNGKVADRIEVSPAQVYQIITADGEFVLPQPTGVDSGEIKQLFCRAFGEPIFKTTLAAKKETVGHNSSQPTTRTSAEAIS